MTHTITSPGPLPAFTSHVFPGMFTGIGVAIGIAVIIGIIDIVAARKNNRPLRGSIAGSALAAVMLIGCAAPIGLVGGALAGAVDQTVWAERAVSYLAAEYNINITNNDANNLASYKTISAVYRDRTITLRVTGDHDQNITRADGSPIRTGKR